MNSLNAIVQAALYHIARGVAISARPARAISGHQDAAVKRMFASFATMRQWRQTIKSSSHILEKCNLAATGWRRRSARIQLELFGGQRRRVGRLLDPSAYG